MTKYYAIQIGGEFIPAHERIETFVNESDARAFCKERNAALAGGYKSREAYQNDANALEWSVFDHAKAEREHPDLLEDLF